MVPSSLGAPVDSSRPDRKWLKEIGTGRCLLVGAADGRSLLGMLGGSLFFPHPSTVVHCSRCTAGDSAVTTGKLSMTTPHVRSGGGI